MTMQHLVSFFGPPAELFELPEEKLKVAYFAPGGANSRVVFAIVGAETAAVVVLRKEPTGAAFEAIPQLLARFAIFQRKRSIRHGDVIRTKLEGSSMDALLVMPPLLFPKGFDRKISWLIPISTAEGGYALKQGAQALMLLFAAQGLDLTDPERHEANVKTHRSDVVGLAKKAMKARLLKPRAPRPKMPAAKLKSDPRNVGKGSFGVTIDQSSNAVRISRRRPSSKRPS